MKLGDARLYLVAPATIASGPIAELMPDLARAGVDVFQLREKELETRDLIRIGEPIARACREAAIPFIVNDRVDVALALGADGVHLGQEDLPVDVARRVLPDAIVGGSTHSREQVVIASHPSVKLDYFAVGPVYETPTKPGRPAAGLELIRFAATHTTLVWFAIGGIDENNLPDVIEAGARRIVVVRAITEAEDPLASARRLSDLLPSPHL